MIVFFMLFQTVFSCCSQQLFNFRFLSKKTLKFYFIFNLLFRKLTLAKINWIFFKDPAEYDSNFEALQSAILAELNKAKQPSGESKSEPVLARQTSVRNEYNFSQG